MSDEATAVETDVESADSEVEETTEPEAAVEAEDSDDTESEGDEDQEEGEEPEVIEFNFGGNKLSVEKGRVPEDVASKLQEFASGTWSDYTKKSQTLAEEKKSLEAEKEAVQTLSKLQGERMNSYAKGLAIAQELERLDQVDLNQLWQSEPDRARQISDLKNQKRAEYDKVYGEVAEHTQKTQKAEQDYIQSLAEKGEARIRERIPEFIPNEAAVKKYVMEKYGVSKKEAENWRVNPSGAEMAWKAMKYDEMQSKARKKKAAPVPDPVKPIKGKGVATQTTPSDKDDMKTWLKKREAQRKKRG